jgi:UDP-N-acetylmuramate--alanine ligase
MKKHIHLIGIGGTGLSAIARLLQQSGYTVSGSDQMMSPLAEGLVRDGIKVTIGHNVDNIEGADIIVRSSAVTDDNPEVLAGRIAGIPVLKRSQFLGQFMESKVGIAVAGTHGKTTTTGMIAWMLTQLGKDPSYIVGGTINQLETNAHAGAGEFFVIEADEYDRMFLGLKPFISVITFMELDHPDCFPTLSDYYDAFSEFASSTQPGGTVLVCGDHENLRLLQERVAHIGLDTMSYGFDPSCTYQAKRLNLSGVGYYTFDFVRKTPEGFETLGEQITITLPGTHNILNTLAALATADLLSLPMKEAVAAVSNYTGTGRRFEIVAVINGITLIDDYAHHPTEIKTTLAAARSRFQHRRIWAIWQPHTYSRTRLLEREFINSFVEADEVIVTEIYASREQKEKYSSNELVKQMDQKKTRFIADLADVTQVLLQELRPSDVVIVLSAGDANLVNKALAGSLPGRMM